MKLTCPTEGDSYGISCKRLTQNANLLLSVLYVVYMDHKKQNMIFKLMSISTHRLSVNIGLQFLNTVKFI